MEHLLKAVILGLIQGLTEFLPVSSSGHLVIFGDILHFKQTGISFEVFVHFGTLLSVLLFFRKEIIQMLYAPYAVWIQKSNDTQLNEYLRWDLYIIVASIPAAFVGLLFKDTLEAAFKNVLLVYSMLLITAGLMIAAQFLKFRKKEFNYSRTFLMGIAQSIAIIPGISRSGSTIFTGMSLGMKPEKVAKFSFLMSLPAIFGAVLLQTRDLLKMPPSSSEMTGLIVGTIVAFVSGYMAILWLLDVVKKGKLQWFGYYCLAVALFGLSWKLLG